VYLWKISTCPLTRSTINTTSTSNFIPKRVVCYRTTLLAYWEAMLFWRRRREPYVSPSWCFPPTHVADRLSLDFLRITRNFIWRSHIIRVYSGNEGCETTSILLLERQYAARYKTRILKKSFWKECIMWNKRDIYCERTTGDNIGSSHTLYSIWNRRLT